MWILQTPEGHDGDPLIFRLASPGHKTVGRATTADFVVEAALVSRFHCRLTLDSEDRLVLEDLSSTNGTFVNDERVEQRELKAGDRLRMGRLHLTVSSVGRPT